MSVFVVDSSVAASWILPDETSDVSAEWLALAWAQPPLAPAHWPTEIANTALQAHQRGRLTDSGLRDARALLTDLTIEVEGASLATVWDSGLELAQRHGLTVYDALYLEVAIRRRARLATFDKALLRAAAAERVSTLSSDSPR